MNSSLHSSGSLYMSFGFENRLFSRASMKSATMSAMTSGRPKPTAKPIICPMVKRPSVSASPSFAEDASDASDNVPTKAAI